MTRSNKLWFEVAAVATIAALLGIAALAMLVEPNLASGLTIGLAIATSTVTVFFCVFAGAAAERRRVGRRDPASMSIKDELDLRKLRAKGARVQFR
jgi:hypothetical protein